MSDKGAVGDLLEVLRERVKTLTAQGKSLKGLQEALAAGDAAAATAALAALDGEALEALQLGPWVPALLGELREGVKALRTEQRRLFGQGLQAAAEAAGRTFRRLGEQPPEYLLAPFTVLLDPRSLEAVLLFAREELDRGAAVPEEVVKRAQSQDKELALRQLPVEEHFDALLIAYRAALGARGLATGERLDLVELLPQVALQYQARSFREDPHKGRFFSYSKARFLYDLARLRDGRALVRHQLRLDLGTATGDSVKKKSQVFFVPTADGAGQYFLSARFVPAR